MTMLRVTRGLPASGKSTWAEDWVNGQPNERARVNRDDLRFAMFRKHGRLSHEQEHMVTVAEVAMAEQLLKAGKDVIVDAMHLRPQYVRRWNKIAQKHGAFFEIDEFEISVEESMARNGDRMIHGERFVPYEAIKEMTKYLTKDGKLMPYEPLPEEPKVEVVPYVADETKPGAIIVDIDGTLALHNGRNPYDLSRVLEDSVCEPVRMAMEAADGHYRAKVILLSGREDTARKDTVKWLREQVGWTEGPGGGDYSLYMRKAGDGRPDTIVKRELFDAHVRHSYNVHAVIDDRPAVCRMWRELGLFTFQVGDPHVEF